MAARIIEDRKGALHTSGIAPPWGYRVGARLYLARTPGKRLRAALLDRFPDALITIAPHRVTTLHAHGPDGAELSPWGRL